MIARLLDRGREVQSCSARPANPANFATITLRGTAVPAPLGHGDMASSCFANAAALCSDEGACTIDAMEGQTETCLADHPPVDCDDSNLFCGTDCNDGDGDVVCDDLDNCLDDANPNQSWTALLNAPIGIPDFLVESAGSPTGTTVAYLLADF